jgi:hypothetical protein
MNRTKLLEEKTRRIERRGETKKRDRTFHLENLINGVRANDQSVFAHRTTVLIVMSSDVIEYDRRLARDEMRTKRTLKSSSFTQRFFVNLVHR